MLQKKVRIENKLGLHARPASLFVKTAGHYKSNVSLTKDGIEVNGKSIMGLLMLAVEGGSEVLVQVDGPDEEKAMEALIRLIEGKFDEE
jgi:phosphocarrier protein HPr